MAGLGEIFGGLLEGGGKAMETQGAREREAALKILEQGNAEVLREQGMGVEHGYRGQELTQQSDAAMARTNVTEAGANTRNTETNAARIREAQIKEAGDDRRDRTKAGRDSDELFKIIPGEDGTQYGVTKGNKTVQLKDQDGKPIIVPDDKVPSAVTAAIIKAHTSYADDGSPTVNMAGALNDLDQAKQRYGARPNPGAVDVPPALASEPDGTIVAKGGKNYKKQGNKLIPQ